jgi:Putative auto-transporter adhesin, head GIN domain
MRAAMMAGSALLLGACTADAQNGEGQEGSGRMGQREFQVAGFDRVSLGGSHNVIVTVGGAPSVRAEGDAETLERLEIRVEDGELHIGMKKGKWSVGWHRDRPPVTIRVTAPTLSGASIGGSGDMRIDKVEGGRFAASIGGSGDMDIASLKVDEARFSIAGSGGIRAKGSAGRSEISIAGSGDIDAAELESRTAKVSVVGSGDVRARATETADVSVMGSGDVTLAGPAKCTISKMGSGEVRCNA